MAQSALFYATLLPSTRVPTYSRELHVGRGTLSTCGTLSTRGVLQLLLAGVPSDATVPSNMLWWWWLVVVCGGVGGGGWEKFAPFFYEASPLKSWKMDELYCWTQLNLSTVNIQMRYRSHIKYQYAIPFSVFQSSLGQGARGRVDSFVPLTAKWPEC